MSLSDTLLFLSLLLSLSLALEPLAARLHLPFAAVLIVLGFIVSELAVRAGFDTGIRADAFRELILFVFLPILVFSGAFTLDPRELRRNLPAILFLAIPLLLLSTLVIAVMVYQGIGHPTGFPWLAALLTGALLSATDPMAVVSLFERLGVNQRLTVLIDGEAAFNDAAAIVLFSVVLGLALHPSHEADAWDSLLRFALVFFGGLLTGTVVGLLTLRLGRFAPDARHQAVITLIGAYTAYLLAERWLAVSGVMAVLVSGLILGQQLRGGADARPGRFVSEFWELLGYLASALVYLLMGVTITLSMFEERWLAMLIGIGGVLVARALGCYAGLPILNALPGSQPLPLGLRTVLFWGGARGAVTLALALSLPVELEYWWTIQSIAFGVVLFTLLLQTPCMPLVLRTHGFLPHSHRE